MSVRELINKMYGVQTYQSSTPANTTIQTTPTLIWSGDPGCLQMTLINTGAKDLYIFTDETVSTTKGILIAANGGSYEIDFVRFMELPSRQWWGVGNGGTTTIMSIRQNILA